MKDGEKGREKEKGWEHRMKAGKWRKTRKKQRKEMPKSGEEVLVRRKERVQSQRVRVEAQHQTKKKKKHKKQSLACSGFREWTGCYHPLHYTSGGLQHKLLCTSPPSETLWYGSQLRGHSEVATAARIQGNMVIGWKDLTEFTDGEREVLNS